ncbi:MAG: hypothetical protein ACI9SQ_001775 [Rubritalea sp.]|jgi:hypothetical protein
MRLPPALRLSLFCFSIKPLSLFKWYKFLLWRGFYGGVLEIIGH